MLPFRHVLVATDFSTNAAPAVDLAVEIARGSDAALTLVHVADVAAYAYSSVSMAGVDLLTPMLDAAQGELAKALAAVHTRLPDAKAMLRQGVAADELVQAARVAGADLIVVGTHGRTGMAHLVVGSVAEKVVRNAPVPVLTVRSGPRGS